MTFSLIVLVFVLALGVGIALLLAQSLRAQQALPGSGSLKAEIARIERYAFIWQPEGDTGDQRRRWMRRQLVGLRRDFWRFWNVCRLLAPYSEDPDFAKMLVIQLALFHRLWISLWIMTFGAPLEKAVRDFTRLVDAVKLLRESAQGAVERVESAAFETICV